MMDYPQLWPAMVWVVKYGLALGPPYTGPLFDLDCPQLVRVA